MGGCHQQPSLPPYKPVSLYSLHNASPNAPDGNNLSRTSVYKDRPDPQNGSINIGAVDNPLDGHHNVDIEPKATGVHRGDATNMPDVPTGYQSRINMDNPHGFDPLNPEVLRILSPDGEIRMVGIYSNRDFRNAVGNVEKLQLQIISRRQINFEGYKTTSGASIRSEEVTEVIIRRQ